MDYYERVKFAVRHGDVDEFNQIFDESLQSIVDMKAFRAAIMNAKQYACAEEDEEFTDYISEAIDRISWYIRDEMKYKGVC